MAEAIAAIGLAASIVQLLDVGGRLLERLNEFSSTASDMPETFRDLSYQLPLLTRTLERLQTQTGTDLPKDVTVALKTVTDNTIAQVVLIQKELSNVLPRDGDGRRERVLKAFKSLAREDKIFRAVEKIHRSIDILTLHQTSLNADTSNRLLDELTRLSVTTLARPITPPPPFTFYDLGVCLGQAPQIEPEAFAGRTNELSQLREWLPPGKHPSRQIIVSVVGMGGIGKTQLSIAHVRDCAKHYSSVFWVNATDESSVKRGLADINNFMPHLPTSIAQSLDDEKVQVDQVRKWLSEPGNDKWLLIFDNYDDPNLPNLKSPTGYDIRPFFPTRAQGSILITSRSPKLTFGKQLKVFELKDPQAGLDILSARSGQDLSDDEGALNLVKRIRGLPLALATAGTYIGRAGITCSEYLELYEQEWIDLVGSESEGLLEYEERTMSSTWNLSLSQVKSKDEDAATLLNFLAYLSNHDITFELLQAGASGEHLWLERITKSKIMFQRAVSKLQDYSLVETVARTYQIHPCLQDWLIASFNTPPDLSLFNTSLMCIVNSMKDRTRSNFWSEHRLLLDHARHLLAPRFHDLWEELDMTNDECRNAIDTFIGFLKGWDLTQAAIDICKPLLLNCERSLGPDNTNTLDIVNHLGNLYMDQTMHEEAERMYNRAFSGKEKEFGPNDTGTLAVIHNLGYLYDGMLKYESAERMYKLALAGRERWLGPSHYATLQTVCNTGVLYMHQARFDEAEQMFRRALNEYQKSLGPEHLSVLQVCDDLGLIYCYQGKLEEAQRMYERALAGKEKALGRAHTSTTYTLNGLGELACRQGRPDQAEQLYLQVIAGLEVALGRDDSSTLLACTNLGDLYSELGEATKAERMYERAIMGYEHLLADTSSRTQAIIAGLGVALCSSFTNFRQRPSAAQKNLTRLIELTVEEFPTEKSLLQCLGRIMVCLDDNENAQQAYAFCINKVEGEPADFSGSSCDGCFRKLTVDMGLHICDQCVDTYLCDKCMNKYGTEGLSIIKCVQHRFWTFDNKPFTDAITTGTEDEASIRAWLRNLSAQYTFANGKPRSGKWV